MGVRKDQHVSCQTCRRNICFEGKSISLLEIAQSEILLQERKKQRITVVVRHLNSLITGWKILKDISSPRLVDNLEYWDQWGFRKSTWESIFVCWVSMEGWLWEGAKSWMSPKILVWHEYLVEGSGHDPELFTIEVEKQWEVMEKKQKRHIWKMFQVWW